MAVVNKFNVNKQQVTLDPDIIENMSANDVSYNTSTQYNENTVGDKLNKLSELEEETNTNLTSVRSDLVAIENVIQNIDGDTLYVTDANGNVIAKISNQGIESVDVTIKDGKKLSEMPNDTLEEFYKDNLYISDANGNIVLHVDGSGHLHYLDDDIFVLNDWKGKVIATYGDSVTAVNNGDFSYPYNFTEDLVKYRWGNRVAQYFGMSNHYGRGIGGTKYMWNVHGGSLCLVETATGIAKNRYDNYTYDDYLADNTIITIPSGQTAVRGCGCSWLRITSMFPESIKDNVDVVTIMFHNDAADNANASFIEGSTVDLEWSQSDYYTDYGGDYNIETFRGAIASLIMKMQAWMPNAVLVLMSPISGQGTANRFKAYFNILPQVSVGDVYSPDNTPMRMTVTAITDTEMEKSITFATFEYAHKLPVGATSLIKISGASGSASTLNFTSLSDKNSDGTLIDINLHLPDGIYNQIDIVDTMSQKLSIPFINIFHNCGINGFNKRLYIADTIHPYSEDGSKMIARAVIGGLKTIIPNF